MPQSITHDFLFTVKAPPVSGAVRLLARDPVTRGSWIGTYGRDGQMIPGLAPALPAGVTATLSPQALVWVGGEHTTGASALSRPGAPDDRIVSQWYAGYVNSPQDPGPFHLDLAFPDDSPRRVAMYFYSTHGPEPANRHMMVQGIDPATGAALTTDYLDDDDGEFMAGVWLVYEVVRGCRFTFTRTGIQQRPILNGVFFGPGEVAPPPPPPPPPPDGAIGTATITADKADHVVTFGGSVTVSAEVLGAVEVYADSPAGRIDLPPTGGTFSFLPKVSGPFPLVAVDAAGGRTVKPMSVIVKHDRPALDPTAPPTLTTVQDGPLDDPATWGGRLPGPDETVEVKHGCTYSGRKFWCGRLINTGAIVVRGGVLHTTDYDDRGVGALSLIGEGMDKALVMLHNRPKHLNDTADFWRCVWVRGRLTVRGKPATRRLELAAPARAGHVLIRLASPCHGWGPGQKILLHDTRIVKHNDDDHREEEVAVIRGVSDDGLTVHLLSPLRYDHLPCLERDGSVVFRPKVFHLIANAGFVTSDPTTVETRCHVRIEGTAHLDCDNWLIHGTGRSASGARFGSTTQERNPLRLHNLVGPDGGVDGQWQWRMTNGVTLDPPPVVPIGQSRVSWGVTLDNTHWGLYENNVSFNWDGAHHVLFSGNETDNLFKGNSAIALPWVGHSENNYGNVNVAHTAAGFWCRGPGSRFVDNFASGLYRPYVIAPYMHGSAHNVRVPSHKGADVKAGQFVTVNIRAVPLREFRDNEAGGYVINFLELWGVGADGHGTSPAAGFAESLVLGARAWRFRDHVYYNYMTAGVTFDGVKAREGSLGFFSSDYMAYQFKLKNADIRGVNTGVLASPLYDQVYENCYIEAFIGIEVGLLWASGWSAQNIPPRHVVIKGLRWSPLPESFPAWWGPQRAIKMAGQPFWGAGASNSCNFAAANEVRVEAFQGNVGDNFRLYFKEQAADQPCPATVAHPLEPTPSNPNPVQTYRYWGCPEEGLTNAQAWAKYGVSFGGSVAPSDCVERDEILGLVALL